MTSDASPEAHTDDNEEEVNGQRPQETPGHPVRSGVPVPAAHRKERKKDGAAVEEYGEATDQQTDHAGHLSERTH